ncbi:MAG: helix-turn-helix domain-containing protein [Planctomycetota bacterium]
MDAEEFSGWRKRLGKTQLEMARLLGTSLRAVHAYEQGWRKVPVHVERQVLFLVARAFGPEDRKPCWDVKGCPPERRDACPAREFRAGDLCWFVNGTLCAGKPRKTWTEKMRLCRACAVFQRAFGPPASPRGALRGARRSRGRPGSGRAPRRGSSSAEADRP